MAGWQSAWVEVHKDQSIDVVPIACPYEDEHYVGVRRCYTIMFDGERRSCPYWMATTHRANCSHRVDASVLAAEVQEVGLTRAHAGVLCQIQRRNRQAGC